MSIRKEEGANLRERYPIYVQLGLIGALGILVVAFRVDWTPATDFEIVMPEQEQISIEEIPPTDQIEQPPPPPKPPVPIVVPDDAALEDDELNLDAALELDDPIANRTPPPPAEEEEEEPEPEIFMVVEEMPEPIGGMQAIYERAKNYPEMAKRAGVEGRVFVQFIVDEEGNVREPVVLRGVGAGLDELAVEAIEKTRFKPGKQRGKPVKVKMSLSILFKLK